MRNRHDLAMVRRRDWSRNGRILVKRQVCPGFQIVLNIRVQGEPQSAFVGDDDVIETFAANGPDQPLGIRVLRGERGAVRISSIPIAAAVVVQAWNAESRS